MNSIKNCWHLCSHWKQWENLIPSKGIWETHWINYHKFSQTLSDLMVSGNIAIIFQNYRCIKTMGQEKSCNYNRSRERKAANSKRQGFQHTSTKCHILEVCILWQNMYSERSNKTKTNCEFKEDVFQLPQIWSRCWLPKLHLL